MKRFLLLFLLGGVLMRGYAQTLDIRPQFGHDALWGDVSGDGRHVVTVGRYSMILWDVQSGNVLREIPGNFSDVRFIKGFPYYCVAVNQTYDNGFRDSSRKVRSIINFLTGKKMSEITEDALTEEEDTPYYFSAPFDPNGRFEVGDSRSGRHYRIGGRLPGGTANLDISPDGSLLLVAGKHPVIWDLDNFRVLREIPLYEEFMNNSNILDAGLDILPVPVSSLKGDAGKAGILVGYRQFFKARFIHENHILAGAPGGSIYEFSAEGELLKEYRTESNLVYDAHLFADRILAATSNNWVFSGDLSCDSLSRALIPKHDGKIYKIIYEILPVPEYDCYLASSDAGIIYIGSLSNPKKELEIIEIPWIMDLALSFARTDRDHVLVTSSAVCYVLDLRDRSFEIINPRIPNDIQACCVLSDGRIICGSDQGRLSVIKKGEKTASQVLSLGHGYIRGIVEDDARDKIYVSASDGAVHILDRRNLSLIATAYHLGDGNSIIFTPDSYYSADKDVADMVMYGNGLELFSFDRFDLIRNRPDIVQERLGASPEECAFLKRVYLKRLHRMGYDEADLSMAAELPKTAITRFPSAEFVSVSSFTMGVQCSDKKHPIKRIMAWINGTPILGTDGLPVDGNTVVQDIEVQLASGENNIEVSCINAAGIESLRQSRTITFVSPSRNRDLYIVSLGVSSYSDPHFNLSYAAKDARDVKGLFQEYCSGQYDHVYTLLMEDKDVTRSSIGRVKEFLGNSTRDDSVIAFYAGHGLVGPDYEYYLSTFDTDFSHPESAAMEFGEFESLFADILPLNKLIFVDACHSGEIDKEDIREAERAAVTEGKVLFRGTALGKESDESKTLRARFNDIRRGMGATIMASSNGLEVSVEGDEWQNGLFTWTLKSGFQQMKADSNGDGRITVAELLRYSEAEVARISEGRQTPSVRSINPVCDFVLTEREL